jgi:hypothetical protein
MVGTRRVINVDGNHLDDAVAHGSVRVRGLRTWGQVHLFRV